MAKILKVTLFVTLLAAGAFIGLMIFKVFFWNEHQSKKTLAQEVSNISIPDTCSEESRKYATEGIDMQSSWHVVYRCDDVTAGPAYNLILGSLKSRGYDEPSPGYAQYIAAFTYNNSDFRVSYNFDHEETDSANNTSDLYNTKVKKIRLSIYRSTD